MPNSIFAYQYHKFSLLFGVLLIGIFPQSWKQISQMSTFFKIARLCLAEEGNRDGSWFFNIRLVDLFIEYQKGCVIILV